MERNEILAAAQQEKVKGEEYENHQALKSGAWNAFFAVILAGVLILVEYVIKNTINLPLMVLLFGVTGTSNLWNGKKFKKIIPFLFGCVELLAALAFLIAFIGQAV